jgi:hypothetical protein
MTAITTMPAHQSPRHRFELPDRGAKAAYGRRPAHLEGTGVAGGILVGCGGPGGAAWIVGDGGTGGNGGFGGAYGFGGAGGTRGLLFGLDGSAGLR